MRHGFFWVCSSPSPFVNLRIRNDPSSWIANLVIILSSSIPPALWEKMQREKQGQSGQVGGSKAAASHPCMGWGIWEGMGQVLPAFLRDWTSDQRSPHNTVIIFSPQYREQTIHLWRWSQETKSRTQGQLQKARLWGWSYWIRHESVSISRGVNTTTCAWSSHII